MRAVFKANNNNNNNNDEGWVWSGKQEGPN